MPYISCKTSVASLSLMCQVHIIMSLSQFPTADFDVSFCFLSSLTASKCWH